MVSSYYATQRAWHPGELAIQRRLGYDEAMAGTWAAVSPFMPEQHQVFHATRLHFLPLSVLDSEGRPWTGFACGQDGLPGFVSVRDESTMDIDADTWVGDPLHECRVSKGSSIAGIGIELSTRRRNKFAGHVLSSSRNGNLLRLHLNVDQALGNCPKYINVRKLAPTASRTPVLEASLECGPLSDAAVALVHAADTVFLSTTFPSPPDSPQTAHQGQNHRGGLPGFTRVLRSKTIVLPDYSGNRFMQSLGNVEVSCLAGLAVPDFVTGDILYVTGSARTLVGEDAQMVMPRQNVVTLIDVVKWTLVRDALPIRQVPGSTVEKSPYSPPVRYLTDDVVQRHEVSLSGVGLLLAGMTLHSAHDATFTFDVTTSTPPDVLPGQAAVIDLSPLFGRNDYQHMAHRGAEKMLNDDSVRTWTISKYQPSFPASLSVTIREKRGGALTPKLLALARKLADIRPELLNDARPLDIKLGLVGIAGDFVLPPSNPKTKSLRMLWLAGGIGITPFIAMLRDILFTTRSEGETDILLVMGDQTPRVAFGLLSSVLPASAPHLRLQIYFFASKLEDSRPSIDLPSYIDVHHRQGRLEEAFFATENLVEDVKGREVFLCGGPGFEGTAMTALATVNIAPVDVHREGFNY